MVQVVLMAVVKGFVSVVVIVMVNVGGVEVVGWIRGWVSGGAHFVRCRSFETLDPCILAMPRRST